MDLNKVAVHDYFSEKSAAVICKTPEEIDIVLDSIDRLGNSGYSGAYEEVHYNAVVIAHCVNSSRVGWGSYEQAERYSHYKFTTFAEFIERFCTLEPISLVDYLIGKE